MDKEELEGGVRSVENIIAPTRGFKESIPRSPSPAMLDAPVHVALATFAQPRTDLVTGRYIGWVIVVDKTGEEPNVYVGGTAALSPVRPVMAALQTALEGVSGDVWVSLSRQRKGLAVSLSKAGYSVTTSFGVGSRAEALLRTRLADQIHRSQNTAMRSGAIEEGHRARRVQPQEREPQGEVFWWPAEWRVTGGSQAEHLVVATDATLEAVDYSRSYAIAAVTEDGDLVLNSGYTQAHIGEIELEALVLGIELVAERRPREATLLSDSCEAIEIARILAARVAGSIKRAGAVGCSRALRERCMQAWREATKNTKIKIEYVRGHDGLLLNEAADAIAGASRRAAMIPRGESERKLNRFIDQRLAAVVELLP